MPKRDKNCAVVGRMSAALSDMELSEGAALFRPTKTATFLVPACPVLGELTMITYVTEAHYVDGYRIAVTFNTGESAVVDFSRMIAETPQAAPLQDAGQFKSFYLDGWPTLAWPCGFDIAPETLYQMATGKLPEWMAEAGSAEPVLSHA